MAYLGGEVDAHKDQDVRRGLHRLAAMAEQTGCCVLVLRHLNKAAAANALYRGGGSIGIIGQARAAYLAAPDPADETGQRRVLAVTKINIAAEPAALAYRVVPDALHGCARIDWLGVSDQTARQLLTAPADDERGPLDEAAGWLQGYLIDHGSEAESRDVKAAARKEGIAERTLQRALKQAGVTAASGGFPRKTIWRLTIPADDSRAIAPVSGVAGATDNSGGVSSQVNGHVASHAAHSGAIDTGAADEWPEGSLGAEAQE